MKKLPEGWVDLQLGDICEFTQGVQIPFSEQIQEYQEGYIRYLYIRDFFSDKDKCYIKDIYPHKIMKKEDIMIVNTGNTAGSVYSGAEGVLSNNAFKLTFNNNILNRDYLYQFLKSYIFDNYIKRLFNSAGQPHVGHKNVALVPVQLPPLEEQKKIAEILSTVDQKITFVDNQIEETELLKKGLMQKLLTEGIGHDSFKDSEIGKIPENWEVCKLEDITEVVTKGTTPTTLGYQYEKNGINFIKVESIDNNGNFDKNLFAHISKEANTALKRSIILENDILYSIAGALGRVAVANNSILPANTNQALAIIRLKDKSNVSYIYFYLNSPYIKKYIDKVNVQNAQANLSLQNIKKFKIAIPPIEEQKKIAEILSTADEKLENLKSKKESFEELKKGLMQKLLTGEVRV